MLKPYPLVSALALMLPGSLIADSLKDPFATANRQPLVQVYGLPDAESARLHQPGDVSLSGALDIANSFSSSFENNRAIFLDGESYRANLKLRFGLQEGWEVGLDLPYWLHDGGFMDGAIEDFHDLFDLDNGNRELFSRNQLRYRYIDTSGPTTVLYTLDERSDGVGDLQLSASYQLSSSQEQYWALRTTLKLPTGDADELTGSEATDLAVALHFSDYQWLDRSSLALHGNIGVLWMEDTDVVESEHNDVVMFASANLSWQWRPAVVWKIQLDGHSEFYDSPLRELGEPALQLILGGSFQASKQWQVDVSISEDLLINRSPDVVFQLGVRTAL